MEKEKRHTFASMFEMTKNKTQDTQKKTPEENIDKKVIAEAKKKSPFVEGWLSSIDEKIEKLKDSKENVDLVYLDKGNRKAIYALNEIKQVLENKIDMKPEDLKDNVKLNNVIDRLKRETPNLRNDVKDMINQMKAGQLPEPVEKKKFTM